jgi:hypothetical protein
VSAIREPVVLGTAAKRPALEPVKVIIVAESLDKQNFILWAKIVTMSDGDMSEVQLFSGMTRNSGRIEIEKLIVVYSLHLILKKEH